MRVSFEGYIDKATSDIFAGEGKKEGHTGQWFILNTRSQFCTEFL